MKFLQKKSDEKCNILSKKWCEWCMIIRDKQSNVQQREYESCLSCRRSHTSAISIVLSLSNEAFRCAFTQWWSAARALTMPCTRLLNLSEKHIKKSELSHCVLGVVPLRLMIILFETCFTRSDLCLLVNSVCKMLSISRWLKWLQSIISNFWLRLLKNSFCLRLPSIIFKSIAPDSFIV